MTRSLNKIFPEPGQCLSVAFSQESLSPTCAGVSKCWSGKIVCPLMTVEVTSQFEVITPRILLLCQEGSRLLKRRGPGANDDQDNHQSVPNSHSASCILSSAPSVEQHSGRFMDKTRIIKGICSNDCILNDQCDDGIKLTLSCVFYF